MATMEIESSFIVIAYLRQKDGVEAPDASWRTLMADTPGSGSVKKAFAILELLNSSRRGWNISEISRKLSIPKSSTHVLVSTLHKLGYITDHLSTHRFQLSPKIYGLGRRALQSTPLPEIALPHLHWGVQQISLTTHVGLLEKRQVIFIQKVDGPGIIKFDTYIGKCSELHCTALGKALLACQPVDLSLSLLEDYPFHRFTKNTIHTKAGFLEELAHVRKLGYAMDNEEEELGIRCVATPIFSGGSVVAAVSFTGTTTQIPMERINEVVHVAKCVAAKITAQL